MKNIITHAAHILDQGGTLLYPTDTIWGIGCDATNASAIEKIYHIKQRDHSKSMLILVAQGLLPHIEALSCCDRPTTYILPAKEIPFSLPSNLVAHDGTIGVRVPHHTFCQELLKTFGKPIVSTSANFSGCASPATYADIAAELKEAVDYAVPNLADFKSGVQQSSRIVKIEANGSLTTLRP